MQDTCDYETVPDITMQDCTKNVTDCTENFTQFAEKSTSTLDKEMCDIKITLPSVFDFIGNDYSNIQHMDNYEKCIKLYRYMCQFSGTALVLMYYFENNPQFFEKTFPNQMLDLLFPFFIGSTFGKVITPVTFFYYSITSLF